MLYQEIWLLNTGLGQNIQQYNFKFHYNYYRIEINFIKLCSVEYDLAAVCGSKTYLLVYNFVQLSFGNSVDLRYGTPHIETFNP